jgi:hypothetical protein
MRDLTDKEQQLYDFLKTIETEISKDDLCKKLDWSEQEFLDVAYPLSRDFENYNARHCLNISKMIAIKEEEIKIAYFSAPLIDCALLLEEKLIELNDRELFNDPQYKIYRRQWKKYRES